MIIKYELTVTSASVWFKMKSIIITIWFIIIIINYFKNKITQLYFGELFVFLHNNSSSSGDTETELGLVKSEPLASFIPRVSPQFVPDELPYSRVFVLLQSHSPSFCSRKQPRWDKLLEKLLAVNLWSSIDI